jgi:hypothetical protein
LLMPQLLMPQLLGAPSVLCERLGALKFTN